MLKKIELKLIDDEGNYSVAHIDYKGLIDTLYSHNINLMEDAFKSMVAEYEKKGKLEIRAKKDPIAEQLTLWEEAHKDGASR